MLRRSLHSIGTFVLLAAPAVLAALAGCGGEPEAAALFRLLSPRHTGVTFSNPIRTDDSVNVQNDVYIYNGAGAAAGDIDNDGLPDLFFSGNMVSSRLYLNKGDMRFEDARRRRGTLAAGKRVLGPPVARAVTAVLGANIP